MNKQPTASLLLPAHNRIITQKVMMRIARLWVGMRLGQLCHPTRGKIEDPFPCVSGRHGSPRTKALSMTNVPEPNIHKADPFFNGMVNGMGLTSS